MFPAVPVVVIESPVHRADETLEQFIAEITQNLLLGGENDGSHTRKYTTLFFVPLTGSGAADRPVPRAAGRGGGGPVDGGDAGDAALGAGSGVSVRPVTADGASAAARTAARQLSRRMARMRRNST